VADLIRTKLLARDESVLVPGAISPNSLKGGNSKLVLDGESARFRKHQHVRQSVIETPESRLTDALQKACDLLDTVCLSSSFSGKQHWFLPFVCVIEQSMLYCSIATPRLCCTHIRVNPGHTRINTTHQQVLFQTTVLVGEDTCVPINLLIWAPPCCSSIDVWFLRVVLGPFLGSFGDLTVPYECVLLWPVCYLYAHSPTLTHTLQHSTLNINANNGSL
jgi:hypothetical protein